MADRSASRARNASSDLTEPTAVSWNQRHRLGQTAEDADSGIFNPHHIVEPLELVGPLNFRALNRAWRALQDRHLVLRSGFDLDLMVWQPGLAVAIDVEEIASGTDDLAALQRQCARPFDLRHGPVSRLVVIRRSAQVTYFALVVEHLVSDGWSLDLLMRDLRVFYASELGICEPDLPAIEMPYPAFNEQQERLLASSAGQRALERVAHRLQVVGAVPSMPLRGFSGTRPIRHELTRSFQREIPEELYTRVQKAARSARITPLAFVHAAFHHALSAASSTSYAATTLSLANREQRRTHHCVGWLVRKAVLVTTPQRYADVEEYLTHFRKQMLAVLDDADIPWPALIAHMDDSMLGRHAQIPYITFNANPTGIRAAIGDVGEFFGLVSNLLPISVGWRDASIATHWDELEGGVLATITFKTSWYSLNDVTEIIDSVLARLDSWT